MKWLTSAALAMFISIAGTPAAAIPLTHKEVAVSQSFTSEDITVFTASSWLSDAKKEYNKNAIKENINKLRLLVGDVHYIPTGSTPRGWDCSGLVMWYYEQLDVTLVHSATAQKGSGTMVSKPKLGDIVAFAYSKGKSAYHVGIYIGNGKMIHAGGKRGDMTSIVEVSEWAKWNGNSKVSYTRILD